MPAKTGNSSAARKLGIGDLKSLKRQIETVPWPGGAERQVGIMKLNCLELQESYFAARERFEQRQVAVDLLSKPYLDEEEAYQHVYRFLIDPDRRAPPGRVFPNANKVREALTFDEVQYLMREYRRLWESSEEDPEDG